MPGLAVGLLRPLHCLLLPWVKPDLCPGDLALFSVRLPRWWPAAVAAYVMVMLLLAIGGQHWLLLRQQQQSVLQAASAVGLLSTMKSAVMPVLQPKLLSLQR